MPKKWSQNLMGIEGRVDYRGRGIGKNDQNIPNKKKVPKCKMEGKKYLMCLNSSSLKLLSGICS